MYRDFLTSYELTQISEAIAADVATALDSHKVKTLRPERLPPALVVGDPRLSELALVFGDSTTKQSIIRGGVVGLLAYVLTVLFFMGRINTRDVSTDPSMLMVANVAVAAPIIAVGLASSTSVVLRNFAFLRYRKYQPLRPGSSSSRKGVRVTISAISTGSVSLDYICELLVVGLGIAAGDFRQAIAGYLLQWWLGLKVEEKAGINNSGSLVMPPPQEDSAVVRILRELPQGYGAKIEIETTEQGRKESVIIVPAGLLEQGDRNEEPIRELPGSPAKEAEDAEELAPLDPGSIGPKTPPGEEEA